MLVIATSVNDPTVSSSGKSTYRVGSQNYLRIISTESTIIDEAGVYEVVVTVRNQYDEGQSVTMDWDQGDTRNWYRASVKSSDRDFWLEVEGNRQVTVVFEVQESSLQNLEEDFIESSIKIWAISNSVEDAASLELPVTLKKTVWNRFMKQHHLTQSQSIGLVLEFGLSVVQSSSHYWVFYF